MRWSYLSCILLGLAPTLYSQERIGNTSLTPRALPPSVNSGATVNPTGLIRFDPEQLTLKRTENRYQLWADKQFLKDIGITEREAHEALRLVREMHFNQYGVIAGSIPAFEYWLSDSDSVKGGLSVKNVIPFNTRNLKVESVAGAWVIRDNQLLLYNFGVQREAALQGLEIIRKYGFNQLGVVGIPNPVMTYLAIDSYAHAPDPREQIDAKELVNKVAQQGLILPSIGYVGGKFPIEPRKLDVTRIQNEWVVVHGKDVIARFGPNLIQARDALRLLLEARVTEVCYVGKSGFSLYLSNGRPIAHAGLGFNNYRLQTASMKIQMVKDSVCITENERIIFEFGDNRADAELVLKVLQHFKFDQLCPVGDPATGGLRLLIRSK